MSQSAEAQQFAAFMRMFKNRTGRSYEALANRTGVSRSSLHRYCTGMKIPADYGAAYRFARECGATHPELRELHRRWTLADARRTTQPEPPTDQPPPPRWPRRLALLGVAMTVLLAGGTVWWVVSGSTPRLPSRRPIRNREARPTYPYLR